MCTPPTKLLNLSQYILGRIMFMLCMIGLLDVIMFSSKVVIPTYYEIYILRYCFVTGIDIALFYNL